MYTSFNYDMLVRTKRTKIVATSYVSRAQNIRKCICGGGAYSLPRPWGPLREERGGQVGEDLGKGGRGLAEGKGREGREGKGDFIPDKNSRGHAAHACVRISSGATVYK